jgi:hypothetical protein
MFVGHYSVALAVKTERNRIPLWVLFVAVQLLDFLWAPFVLLGIEKVRIVPGITATSPLDLYYMPYTHSLFGALFWSALAVLVYKAWKGRAGSRGAWWLVGLAVFSHWILDLIVHRPDLALYDDTWKVGFGLWNYKGIEFSLEIGMLIVGVIIYLRRNGSIARRAGIVILALIMVLIQTMNTFSGRRPISSDHAVAITALAFYTFFAGAALFLEKRQVDPKRVQ